MNVKRVSSQALDHRQVPSFSGRRYLTVGKSVSRWWIVKDNCGRLGAVVRSQDAALRFA
jgi:hypothetical protein